MANSLKEKRNGGIERINADKEENQEEKEMTGVGHRQRYITMAVQSTITHQPIK